MWESRRELSGDLTKIGDEKVVSASDMHGNDCGIERGKRTVTEVKIDVRLRS